MKLEEPELKISRRSLEIEDRKKSQIVDKVVVEEVDVEVEANNKELFNEEWKRKIIEMSKEDRKTSENLREMKGFAEDIEIGLSKESIEIGDKKSEG